MLKRIAPFGAMVPLAFAAILGAPGQASASTVEVQQTVVYRDLDLTHPLGVATLESRIAYALAKVCGEAARQPLSEAMDHRACVTKARADATTKMRDVIVAARKRAGLPASESLAQASLSPPKKR